MRRAILLLAMLLAMILVIGSALPAAAANTKVVKKTFSSTQPITIPAGAPGATSGAAAPYPSEKSAGGFNRGKILDVNLRLKNYTHTFPDDVDVMLSHRGVNRTVLSDVGGQLDVSNITLALDDEAASPLPDSTQLTGGAFDPTNIGATDTFPAPAPTPSGLPALSGFDGRNPNGLWKLWVVDDAGGDVGQFAGGWSITIKARVRT
ncbi:hypothetical protein GBA63_05350 [Rubrobacter tropicus]|uniref:P/Homo B domain-containing protein n=1 Tax=Rubrobacter tropicus TaxID=2653851 RepID=A0A6G8Q6M9_9ACTN|nr:hypothetical protein [Rubrobacter tropicus]QIN82135.1 hypothetical protein GBA63_05350 [Rubrobacter tropicus]